MCAGELGIILDYCTCSLSTSIVCYDLRCYHQYFVQNQIELFLLSNDDSNNFRKNEKRAKNMSVCFDKSGSRILCNSILLLDRTMCVLFNDLSRIYFIIMGNQKLVHCHLNYIKLTRMLGIRVCGVLYVRSTDSSKN